MKILALCALLLASCASRRDQYADEETSQMRMTPAEMFFARWMVW